MGAAFIGFAIGFALGLGSGTAGGAFVASIAYAQTRCGPAPIGSTAENPWSGPSPKAAATSARDPVARSAVPVEST